MARAFQPSFYLWAAGLPDSEHVRMLHTRAREVYVDLGGVDVEDAIADYKAVVARWRAGAEGVGLREGLRCLGAIDRGNVRRDTLRERAWMQARAEVFQRTGRRIPLPQSPEDVDRIEREAKEAQRRLSSTRRQMMGALAGEMLQKGPGMMMEALEDLQKQADEEIAEARRATEALKAENDRDEAIRAETEKAASAQAPAAGPGQAAAQKVSHAPGERPTGKQIKFAVRRLANAGLGKRVCEEVRLQARNGGLTLGELNARVEELLRAA